jgi:hypothetical protein
MCVISDYKLYFFDETRHGTIPEKNIQPIVTLANWTTGNGWLVWKFAFLLRQLSECESRHFFKNHTYWYRYRTVSHFLALGRSLPRGAIPYQCCGSGYGFDPDSMRIQWSP